MPGSRSRHRPTVTTAGSCRRPRPGTQRHGARRSLVAVVLAGLPVLAAACSGGGGATTTTLAPGVAVLGTPYRTWLRGHPAVEAGGQAGYGATVTIDGTTVPEFTDVRRQGGRVVGLHMTLPAGTKLGRAEALVRAELPTDARQTASWQGDFAETADHCEFVNYQSAALARSLGTASPTGSTPNIGTSLYEQSAHRAGASSIAKVNSADLSTNPAGPTRAC